MSSFRNISDDPRVVVYGTAGGRPTLVPVDGLVRIDDEADESYEHQTSIWQRVDA